MTSELLTLINGDAFAEIAKLPKSSVQLTVCSPPYNMGRPYEKSATIADYLDPYEGLIKELYARTTNSGSVCWQVGNFVEGGKLQPLDYLFYPLFMEAGFILRNRIIWRFEHGLHANKRFSGRYETILWFSKSSDYIFNLDPVRVPAKYPGKRAYKGPHKGELSGNPKGKNPSDFWDKVALEDWERGVWEVPNVKANHPEKTIHPCQFPIELVQRCVLAFTSPGDMILDPFMGAGSSAIAAIMHGRKFTGVELEEEYMKVARQRVALYQQNQLPIRELGKPIYQPTSSTRVAQVPTDWVRDAGGP